MGSYLIRTNTTQTITDNVINNTQTNTLGNISNTKSATGQEEEIFANLKLDKKSNYVSHEKITVDLKDHEDHTFCGIMFDIVIQKYLPVECVEINELWVRGGLGPLSIWVGNCPHEKILVKEEAWTKVYSGNKPPSYELVCLKLDTPVTAHPGDHFAFYIHSTRPDDQAIVYDNQRSKNYTYQDNILKILPGVAHISPIPFSPRGWWGWAFRPNREFVGRVSYGIRYLLWRPTKKIAPLFPKTFKRAVKYILLCHQKNRI